MRRTIQIICVLAVLLGIHAFAFAATALPPTIITGSCPSGSARATKWIMFEDLNGDGTYDWVVAGDCDGSVRGRPWRVMADPFDPTSDDLVIGQLPVGIAAVNPDLHSTQLPNGLYAWTLTERTSNGAEVCRYERTDAMELTSTCPPPDKDLH
jgi:hypothetical protein